MTILKASKDDSSKKMSFKDEGIRESAEQMIQALNNIPYTPCYDEAGSNMKKRDDENDELFELRKKSRLLEREMDIKKRVIEQIEQIKKNAVEILSEQELYNKIEKSLLTKTPLRIKAGFDPTAADIHLGHVVLLKKLRILHNMG